MADDPKTERKALTCPKCGRVCYRSTTGQLRHVETEAVNCQPEKDDEKT